MYLAARQGQPCARHLAEVVARLTGTVQRKQLVPVKYALSAMKMMAQVRLLVELTPEGKGRRCRIGASV